MLRPVKGQKQILRFAQDDSVDEISLAISRVFKGMGEIGGNLAGQEQRNQEDAYPPGGFR